MFVCFFFFATKLDHSSLNQYIDPDDGYGYLLISNHMFYGQTWDGTFPFCYWRGFFFAVARKSVNRLTQIRILPFIRSRNHEWIFFFKNINIIVFIRKKNLFLNSVCYVWIKNFKTTKKNAEWAIKFSYLTFCITAKDFISLKKNRWEKRGFLLILLTAWNFRSDNEIQLMQLFKYVFFFQFYPKSQQLKMDNWFIDWFLYSFFIWFNKKKN